MREYKLLNILASVFFIAITGVIFFDIIRLSSLRHIQIFTINSPLIYAFLIGVVMSIALVLDLWGDIRLPTVKTDRIKTIEMRDVFLFLVGTVAYALLLPYLHFLIGTSLYMGILMFILNHQTRGIGKRLLYTLVAVAATVPTLYAVFHYIFDVVMP